MRLFFSFMYGVLLGVAILIQLTILYDKVTYNKQPDNFAMLSVLLCLLWAVIIKPKDVWD